MTEGPAPIDRAEVQAMLAGESQQRAGEVRCGAAGHPYRVLSDDAGVPRKLVCLCGANEYNVPSPEMMRRYAALSQILSDLDRCKHGRHRGDSCFGCPCGQSMGNLYMPTPGSRVGFDRLGKPYFMPSGERSDPLGSTGDPAAWRTTVRPAPATMWRPVDPSEDSEDA